MTVSVSSLFPSQKPKITYMPTADAVTKATDAAVRSDGGMTSAMYLLLTASAVPAPPKNRPAISNHKLLYRKADPYNTLPVYDESST